ncbi:bifunctional DNA primase/polymerase [Cryobacterium sp. PH31-AA6]|nr:bifunctional DNA primase/polymerase [Cryobacterium sp. PH31-AA6]MDJ0324184.1 bifunctional DNA primase/polymerase [Cryobacterium sp. PH31-AA6]
MATAGLPVRDAALAFARAGTPVFPCATGGKRPLTPAGFHDASCDISQVRTWWARWAGANIGIPTGGRSGIDVVDIDVTATDCGIAEYRRRSADLRAHHGSAHDDHQRGHLGSRLGER